MNIFNYFDYFEKKKRKFQLGQRVWANIRVLENGKFFYKKHEASIWSYPKEHYLVDCYVVKCDKGGVVRYVIESEAMPILVELTPEQWFDIKKIKGSLK